MAYTIRRARPSEYALLPEIERAAASLFATVDWLTFDRDHVSDPEFIAAVAESGAIFVAADDDDVPVGFALTGFLDRALHIHELDVAPLHGRRGLGRRLLDAACAFAVAEGAPAVTLSTFRDIPWNGPFYARIGFREVPRNRWTPAFHLLHHREAELGLPVRTTLFHAEGAGVKKTLTHLDRTGAAGMVDVGAKAMTERVAVAEGAVTMKPATLDLILSGNAKKGDVVGAARIAGIMAAKRTHELIPLAHPLGLTSVAVDITPDTDLPGLRVRASAKVAGKTGVEMEALTAVSVACLTVYDMAKAVDRGMAITGIRLLEKRGGKSGTWKAKGPRS